MPGQMLPERQRTHPRASPKNVLGNSRPGERISWNTPKSRADATIVSGPLRRVRSAPKMKPRKELPDPGTVLDDVTTFVTLFKDGAYMAGDRRVHHTERSKWRLTFRRLAGDAAMRDTARFHFGFTVPFVPHMGAAGVVAAVSDSKGDLGLVPAFATVHGGAWWSALEFDSAPKIIARLPFVDRPDHPAPLNVFVVSRAACALMDSACAR